MTPKTLRENIISLQGHITGLKKDVATIKNNHLKHMSLRIRDLGGKIDKNLLGSFSCGGDHSLTIVPALPGIIYATI